MRVPAELLKLKGEDLRTRREIILCHGDHQLNPSPSIGGPVPGGRKRPSRSEPPKEARSRLASRFASDPLSRGFLKLG
ncbi:hypothetical protein PGTUg99_015524 [Puccinia graminis f. sp. tritici]|uniref:Uncharacterized protein n=1 Tax=Puccinia graminis f. sp. tritici TaxID=56615 RepID=A0A5B0S4A9_PUCGR|nr:hypothetical protein PGTUg99_015524 [Puccinia graminis f. sp. tritici]